VPHGDGGGVIVLHWSTFWSTASDLVVVDAGDALIVDAICCVVTLVQ
jgi:hypothetical protein